MATTDNSNEKVRPPYWLLLLALLSFGGAIYCFWAITQKYEKAKQALTFQLFQSDSAKVRAQLQVLKYRDENGRLNVAVKSMEVSQAYADKVQSVLLDSVKRMGVKLKNVQEALRIKSVTSATVRTVYLDRPPVAPAASLPPAVQADTSRYKGFLNYKDRWLGLTAALPRKLGDTAVVAYKYREDYIITHEWIRPKWYKPQVASIRVVPQNPHTDSTSVEAVTITQPKRFYQTTGFKAGAGAVIVTVLRAFFHL